MPAAARSIACPPATEPVKFTCPNARSAISCDVVSWSRKTFANTSPGTPAASTNAAAMRSPTSSVWVACLSTTALPAISAGTTVFTAVMYG